MTCGHAVGKSDGGTVLSLAHLGMVIHRPATDIGSRMLVVNGILTVTNSYYICYTRQYCIKWDIKCDGRCFLDHGAAVLGLSARAVAANTMVDASINSRTSGAGRARSHVRTCLR